jgi:hypothetical protein
VNGETKGEEEGRSQEQSSNTDAQDLGSSDHAATMIWVKSWSGFCDLCFVLVGLEDASPPVIPPFP